MPATFFYIVIVKEIDMAKVVVLNETTKEVEPWRSPWENPTTDELFKNGPMVTIILRGDIVLSGKYQFGDGKVETAIAKIHLTHTDGWVMGKNCLLRYEKN